MLHITVSQSVVIRAHTLVVIYCII